MVLNIMMFLSKKEKELGEHHEAVQKKKDDIAMRESQQGKI